MLHGLSFLPDCTPDTKSPADYFSDAVRLSVMADQAGMGAVKMTEHYMHAYGGYCPSPLNFLSYVAGQTSSIRLMTGCVLPAFRHPIQLAAEASMLDVLSGGRLDLGVARAWLPFEFAAFGVELDDSRELFTVGVETLVRLWTEESVSVDNRFFSFENVSSMPRPIQTPHIPLWGAAVLSPESFVNLGKAGRNLLLPSSFAGHTKTKQFIRMYRDAFAQAHPDKGRGQVALSTPMLIADTHAEAMELTDHYLQRYLEVWTSAAESWNTVRSSNYQAYTGMAYALRATNAKQMREGGVGVFGTPESVTQQIGELGEELDFDRALWQIDFGAMPGEIAETTLKHLTSTVIPALDD